MAVAPMAVEHDGVNEETELAELDATLCVICMALPRDATIVHGDTGHVCCCLGCAMKLQQRDGLCPMCREPIGAVIRHFSS